MKSVEDYRRQVVEELFKPDSFKTAWTIWQPDILSRTDNLSNPVKIYNLGNQLADVFASTGISGRSQGDLSAAGHVWESLNCWYLNLIFSGTQGIAIQQKKALVPECISDCATINYGTDQTNTESDLLVIIFPKGFDFTQANVTMAGLSNLIGPKLNRFELGVIQCKTNWNDNAQIPMLWDMIYNAHGFKAHSISIGRNGYSIVDLKHFTYSFITVPTQKKPFKSTGMAVKRVRNLSGGNFWGRPTQNGVALSVNEIFNRNFKSAFGGVPIHQSIADAISTKKGIFGMP